MVSLRRWDFALYWFVFCFCSPKFGRGETCYYTATRREVAYTSCGFLWLDTCSSYWSVQYTASECCALWTGPSCSLPICDDLSIDNGEVTISGTADGILASYTCDPYYQLTDGDSIRYCQSDGEWDGQQARCAYMNSCSSSPCLHGGTCHNGLDSYTCTCSLAWDGSKCQINVVDCGYPGDIEGGTVSVSSTKYGGKATYTCNEHFNMTAGDSTRTCQMDFTWSGSKPTCTFVNTCGSNPCQNSGTCINGLDMYSCLCEPGWSGRNCEIDIQPPVLVDCPANVYKNATDRVLTLSWTKPVFTDLFNNTVDVIANYPEEEFEFPWGDFTVQYVATKINNGLSAECTFQISVRPTPCDNLNIPRNGARICNGWKTDYGRVCLLACNQNFTLPPPQTFDKLYVCGASGQWIFPGPMPDCSVQVESEEEALLYQPSSTAPSLTSCEDKHSLRSIQQYYVDVLTQSGELSAYCYKYSEECNIDNVVVTCE